jgi:hypothetical protein
LICFGPAFSHFDPDLPAGRFSRQHTRASGE